MASKPAKNLLAHLLETHLTSRLEGWACKHPRLLDFDTGLSSFDERGSAVDIHNEIHSGVFDLHAMKAASLSDHYAFVDGEEEIVLEASVKKITVKNSTSRQKINTQASIYSFFFGGFFFFISLSLSSL